MRNTTFNSWRRQCQSILLGRWPRSLAALGLLLFSSGNLKAAATVATLGGGSATKPYAGYIDGNTLSQAKFAMPAGMALDPSGTYLFIADYTNNAIRLVSQVGDTANSVTTTFANATNGAGISRPLAVVVDSATNVYVLNKGTGNNGAVLHLNGVAMSSGLVLVYPPLATGLVNATAMAMDGYNNLYVTVNGNKVIRVAPGGGVTTIGTVSQTGTFLQGIAVLDNGQLALSDSGNNGIWIMNSASGIATKFTGFHGPGDVMGSASSASFNAPATISKAGGGILVVADRGNNKVKLVDQAGSVSLLYGVSSNLWVTGAGTFPGWWDGPGTTIRGSAESRQPYGVLVGPDGSVYVTEVYYHILRHVIGTGLSAAQPGYPQIFSGPGGSGPGGIALDPSGASLYIADYTSNAVELLDFTSNQTTTFLGSSDGISHPASVLVDTNSFIYVLNQNAGTNGALLEYDYFGNFLGTSITGLNQPTALTMDGSGNIFIAEKAGSIKVVFPSGASNTIVTISTNVVTLKTNVQLQGIALFDDGYIAVSDAGNHVIWTVNPITKLVSKLTGQLGTNGATLGASNFAKLYQPRQLARAGNNQLVIADYGNNRLVTATRAGAITNVLVSTNSQIWFGRPTDPYAGSSVPMRTPAGVAVSSAGLVYDSEPTNAAIRGLSKPLPVPPSPPNVPLPYFNSPEGIAFDGVSDYLFIADYANNAVQLLDLNDNVTYPFLTAADGVLNPASVLVDTNENVFILNQGTPGNGFIEEYDVYGNDYGPIVTGLNRPTAFTLDGYGNLIVTEQSGGIRAFGAGVSNTIVTITNAGVSLQGVALFDDGTIAVSDATNHVIWTVNSITKLVTKLTGQLHTNGIAVGASNFAKLYQPHQLIRVGGNQIVAADYGNNRLVLVQRNGTVITNNTTYHLNSSVANIWFGQNGDPVATGSPKFVRMVQPFGLALADSGKIFASETYYEDIRGMTGTGLTSPSLNPGVPLPLYSSPAGIALNNEGTSLFIADPTNNTVSMLNLANNQTTVFLDANSGIYQPVDVGLDSSDNLYVLNQGTGGNGSIMEFDKYGNLLGTNAAALDMPTAMKMSFTGDIYVSELNGVVQRFNGSVSNTLATVNNTNNIQLQGIALLDTGAVVVSDAGNHVLWKIAPGATNAALFTGVLKSPGTNFGGVGFAKLNKPMRLAQAYGGLLLIADSGNNRVVVANDLGTVSSALNSTNANIWFGLPIDPATPSSPNFVRMLAPVGLAISSGSNAIVFASENFYKDIRGILSTGIRAPIPPAPAPLNLVALATYGQVVLTWTPSAGATNYYVKRSPSSGGPYTLIGSTSANSFTDTNVLGGATYYYVVSAVNGGGESANSAEASAQIPLQAVPDPQIGYVDFPATTFPTYTSVFHPVASFVFNNDAPIVIVGAAGSQTYYTYGSTSTNGIPDPTTNSASAPSGYQDGLSPSEVANFSIAQVLPDLTIKAVGAKSDGSPNSAIVQARFQFVTANPNISGGNAAGFTISDLTTGAHLYYTVDGSDPSSTNASAVDLGTLNGTNTLWTVSFPIFADTLFKVRAFRANYQDSAIVSNMFTAAAFKPTTISFGTSGGEPRSRFVARPGQFYYAPVTLQLSPNFGKMYSLQFNVVVTNGFTNIFSGNPIAPVINGAGMDFFSMLMTQVKPEEGQSYPPADGQWYLPLLPLTQQVVLGVTNYSQTIFVNTNNNLLGVGWLYRTGFKYFFTDLIGDVLLDFDTTKQDLITYSIAHDTLFTEAKGLVVAGAYSFQVPPSAVSGDQYFIQLGSPSATSDGVGAPGSSIYIQSPAQSQAVTIGSPAYVVGDAAPFHWLNAGDFGDTNLDNADVMQAYQCMLGVNMPPLNSDLYASIDSAGALGTLDSANNYYTNSGTISVFQQQAMWDGNDLTINQMPFGDNFVDINDLYVTFRRSLDPSLVWFKRYWTNNMFVAVTNINYAFNSNAPHLLLPKSSPSARAVANSTPSYLDSSVTFSAGDAISGAGGTVQIPITANVLGSYPLRVLGLNLTVHPLDGSPALTQAVVFSPAAALGVPTISSSKDPANFSAAWLNAGIAGLSSNAVIGTLLVTLPAGAGTNAAYAVHFDTASGSPNGLALFPNHKFTGLITTTARTNSYYHDGIPDSWRLRWFGTIYNVLSVSNACPSGDGVINWLKYVAGVDPNIAGDFPSLSTKAPGSSASARALTPSVATTAIHWPSVLGKKYAIERATSLFDAPWTVLSTNIGTGGDMEFDDTNSAAVKFYRVRIIP